MEQRAFIFDLNGTLIDDMNYHIRAWYNILNSLGAELTIEQVRLECYGKNEELLERIFPGRFTNDEMQEMIARKEAGYREVFRPHLRLMDGLETFLNQALERQILMGIGSAALPENINFVLDGLAVRHFFNAIVSAVDVHKSKPDPETFTSCAMRLGVSPAHCIVFEDSPKGVEAARRAGMKSVIITSMHPKEDFSAGDHIIAIIDDYNDPLLTRLLD